MSSVPNPTETPPLTPCIGICRLDARGYCIGCLRTGEEIGRLIVKRSTPKLGESVDRRLSYRVRVINRLHLFTCEACRRYLSQIKFLHTALAVAANDPETFPTAELSSDAKERIKKVISSSIGNVY